MNIKKAVEALSDRLGGDAEAARLLDLSSATTYWRWKQKPPDSGPGLLWIQLLTERPEMVGWLEQKAAERAKENPEQLTPAQKNAKARMATYYRHKADDSNQE